MKTKQASLKAVITTENHGAKNRAPEMETVDRYLVIDKKTEREVVDCRVYMGRSKSASTVHASIWVWPINKPDGWEYGTTTGSGQAGGYGYDKISSAVGSAISDAGIELFGNVYLGHGSKPDFKKRAHIGGVGETATRAALLAIAYAAGCKDAIVVGI